MLDLSNANLRAEMQIAYGENQGIRKGQTEMLVVASISMAIDFS